MSSSRLLLFTGKGGVGKTTSAAAVGAFIAASGRKTVVVSADPAHSLADVLGTSLNAEPVAVGDSLYAAHLDGTGAFLRSWEHIRDYLSSVLAVSGLDEVTSAEVLTPPGAAELGALLELNSIVDSAVFDVVVVDCAPTSETLRLLALPAALDWLISRARPHSLLGTMWQRASGIPTPSHAVFSALDELSGALRAIEGMLRDPRASMRLVCTPERVAIAETRRLYTTLSVLGYAVDGIVLNRVMPQGADAWQNAWAQSHQAGLVELRESFQDMPLWPVPYMPAEPVGVTALATLGADSYRDGDPAQLNPTGDMRITPDSLAMPTGFAEGADLDIALVGNELIVSIGQQRRRLAIPEILAGRQVSHARIKENYLHIIFGSQ